jgi:hypothetical protein
VWKNVKTSQPAHKFSYCDGFSWLDPRALLAFHTGPRALFSLHTGSLATFAFHTGSLDTFAFHTGRRAIVASDTHYWVESGLKNLKNF